MNVKLDVKHVVTFITTFTLALLVVACGADNAEDTTPEPPTPVAPAEAPQPPEGRPDPGERGQGPGFGGGGPMGFMTIIAEATGLSVEALREEASGGATLAEGRGVRPATSISLMPRGMGIPVIQLSRSRSWPT